MPGFKRVEPHTQGNTPSCTRVEQRTHENAPSYARNTRNTIQTLTHTHTHTHTHPDLLPVIRSHRWQKPRNCHNNSARIANWWLGKTGPRAYCQRATLRPPLAPSEECQFLQHYGVAFLFCGILLPRKFIVKASQSKAFISNYDFTEQFTLLYIIYVVLNMHIYLLK